MISKSIIASIISIVALAIVGFGTATEKFQFKNSEPANKLGIFPTVIAHVEREAKKNTEIWRINKAFLTNEWFEGIKQICKSKDQPTLISWTNCKFDKEGLEANVAWGTPEPKNKTITYMSVEIKPFKITYGDGREEICVMNAVKPRRFYLVLKTYGELPSNNTFPRTTIESVATVHQHQLDTFGPEALDIFGDVIKDKDAIYNFGEADYYKRTDRYDCFLSIASTQSAPIIEEKCSLFCLSLEEAAEHEQLSDYFKTAKIYEIDNNDDLVGHEHHEL